MSQPALIIIDLQNDYFADGAFPLCNAEPTLETVERAIRKAQARALPVVLIQHVVDPAAGKAPFFNADTQGVKIHPRILAAAAQAPVVVKRYADSFDGTVLQETLQALGVDELILCGMMTHNCVTHTALSRCADDYARVTVLSDATATVSEILQRIALGALARRVTLASVDEALG